MQINGENAARMAQDARKANPATGGRDALHKVAGPVRRARDGGRRAGFIRPAARGRYVQQPD